MAPAPHFQHFLIVLRLIKAHQGSALRTRRKARNPNLSVSVPLGHRHSSATFADLHLKTRRLSEFEIEAFTLQKQPPRSKNQFLKGEKRLLVYASNSIAHNRPSKRCSDSTVTDFARFP